VIPEGHIRELLEIARGCEYYYDSYAAPDASFADRIPDAKELCRLLQDMSRLAYKAYRQMELENAAVAKGYRDYMGEREKLLLAKIKELNELVHYTFPVETISAKVHCRDCLYGGQDPFFDGLCGHPTEGASTGEVGPDYSCPHGKLSTP
jgi:hypothetical protein